ncbi:MAG: Hsp20/alpha crystallin family protein [Anaerolineae bacterium]
MAQGEEIQVQETEKQELAEGSAERTRSRQAFVPRADIYETDEAIVVVADMPGVDADTVEITLEEGVLTINGYVEEAPPEGYTLAYAEYRTGDYVRSFRLSNQIDQQNIDARINDGVLRLQLPKVKPTSRKISVSAA